MVSLLQQTCLKPSLSIRRQMMLSFGIPSLVSLAVVVILANMATLQASRAVQKDAEVALRDQVIASVRVSTVNIADKLTATFSMLEGTVQLMVEITQDRIVGYKDDGWEDDRFVPFFDMDTQQNVYPLDSPPLPLDWQINANIYRHNAAEHLPGREFWLDDPRFEGRMTSMSSSYIFQGICDPNVTESSELGYFPNCTDTNNNIQTGGMKPTSVGSVLYRKAADLGVLLKPIFEAQPYIFSAGIYLHNEGAGASINYPGYIIGNNLRYNSSGCDWMRNQNPFRDEPLATEDEIARCHPQGESVPLREQNPMERGWCAAMALDHSHVVKHGPFVALNGVPSLHIGRAIFDRMNGRFVGCAAVPIAIFDLAAIVADALLHEASTAILVRISDGIVVASAGVLDSEGSWIGLHVSETGLVSNSGFDSISEAITAPPYTSQHMENVLRDLPLKHCCGGVVAAYPVPAPPDQEDSQTRPDFILIQSIDKQIFASVNEVKGKINDDALRVAAKTTVTGVVGFVFTILFVLVVSLFFTKPLLWMEHIAWKIVNHANEKASSRDFESRPSSLDRWQPTTEITELVAEFERMVHGFSGVGSAMVAEPETTEIRNLLTWQSDFRHLYTPDVECLSGQPRRVLTRKVSKTPSNDHASRMTEEISSTQTGSNPLEEVPHSRFKFDIDAIVPAPPKKNRGSTITLSRGTPAAIPKSYEKRFVRSPLLCWLIVLLILPSIISAVVLCRIAVGELSKFVLPTVYILATIFGSSRVIKATATPSWVVLAADRSMELQMEAISLIATSKATFASVVLSQPIRDLLVISRATGWLLFGGLSQSAGFTETLMKTEECKYDSNGKCPFYTSDDFICPCDWKDPLQIRSDETCSPDAHGSRRSLSHDGTPGLVTRDLQRRHVAVQRSDSDTFGNRPGPVSFPNTSYNPTTTSWYDTFETMPGSSRGNNSFGYETTYDRARVTSASVVLEMPVFNYASRLNLANHSIFTFFGLEDDGLAAGFGGCSYSVVDMAHWFSTKSNRASEIAPDLCPEGKYGYDPRCREWYAAAKADFFTSKLGGYMTPPYLYQSDRDDLVGITASAPLANPTTGAFVGVSGIDVNLVAIRKSLRRSTRVDIDSFMITRSSDLGGADTVVGPDREKEWEEGAIEDLLFKEESTSEEKNVFVREILPEIKNGKTGSGWMVRNSNGASTREFIAYAPVTGEFLLPINPENFSSGTTGSDIHWYSIGIISKEEDMRSAYDEIEENSNIDGLLNVYLATVVIVVAAFVVFVFVIAFHITRPIALLLELVVRINSRSILDEIPPLRGGSTEFRQVYVSVAKLYKIVRVSNYAFFTGNLDRAYQTTSDALALYRKVKDKKAVAIACNNIGNVLHARTQEPQMIEANGTLGDFQNLIDVAMRSFAEAVAAAEMDFTEAQGLDSKADYAQQLADRLFNRALFLLAVQSDVESTAGVRESALEDIRRTRELDIDVSGYWLSKKLLLENSESFFLRLLRRIEGLTANDCDEEVRNTWDAKELIHDADRLLFAAWNEPSAPLFRSVSRAGRLQQLEAVVIQLELSRGDVVEAARLAMRMFAEDEYLLERSFKVAANAILQFTRSSTEVAFSSQALSSTRADFREMSRLCRSYAIDIGKCVVIALELNERWEGDPLLEKVNANCLKLFDEFFYQEDYVGLVSYTTQGAHTLKPKTKAENAGIQRAMLDLSTSNLSEMAFPALPFAVQMLVESASVVADGNNTFILLLTDGYSWDSNAIAAIKEQIEKLNHERTASTHVVIFGFDMEDEQTREECKRVCDVSKLSFYVDVSISNVDSVFSRYAQLISGETASVYKLQGVTMEKF